MADTSKIGERYQQAAGGDCHQRDSCRTFDAVADQDAPPWQAMPIWAKTHEGGSSAGHPGGARARPTALGMTMPTATVAPTMGAPEWPSGSGRRPGRGPHGEAGQGADPAADENKRSPP